MALDVVKCSHCGYVFEMDLAGYKQNQEVIIAKGFFRKSKPKLESSNYLDLKCPNAVCGRWFEWKVV